ncbi:uncharacterized protein LOC111622236 [Centruroides sculpturatus]|uniref:uncharacterized protein LOC111622236 n=1 Tax=Centruroides sculpturatus TaxID=218467 RepID=UPI000C6DBA37|nr:uncharacterized protein LOC111622236 [Centruroides sculpturatus]
MPIFTKTNTKLFFVQLDAAFAINRITSENTKYTYLINCLDAEILSNVSDLVFDRPAEAPFSKLKDRLLEIFQNSAAKKAKILLEDLALGNQKPSALLRKMRELSASKITEKFLRNLWLQRLPKNIQTVLAVSGDEINKLAILADKVAELTEPTQLASINLEAENPVIKHLELQILELTKKVTELNVSRTARPRYRSREKNRHDPNSKHRISLRSREKSLSRQGYCYYHNKFGSAAWKCRSPCSFDRTADQRNDSSQPK